MRRFLKNESIHILISIAAILLVWFFWSKIPEKIPFRFDDAGNPLEFGNRSTYLYAPFFLILMFFVSSAFIYYMFPKPKRRNKYFLIFQQLRTLTLALLLINQLLNYRELITHKVSINDLVFPCFGLLYLFIGSTLQRKPYITSMETLLPWKLQDHYHQDNIQELIAKLLSSTGVIFILLETQSIPVKVLAFFVLNIGLILVVFASACRYCKIEKKTTSD